MVSTKTSYILKQTCSFKLQVYLSIYDLLVDTSLHSGIDYYLEMQMKKGCQCCDGQRIVNNKNENIHSFLFICPSIYLFEEGILVI